MLPNIVCLLEASNSKGSSQSRQGKRKIDNHVNMVVLGKHCFVIEQGGVCDVSGFAPGSGRKGGEGD